ncbi:MAG: DUF2065 domain-containing protein [Gammaproteobacteria bacterium]|nr:DUF2065 domain-containing protein [Gammaproteobacteria bacterium]
MWSELLTAVALVLVIEGFMPFLNPAALRKTLMAMIQMDDKKMRLMGLTSMIAGVILLYAVH